MPLQDKTTLKGYYNTGDTPSESNFEDLIDTLNRVRTAVYGSRPSAGEEGRLFLPSNGFYLERDTGAAWTPWGPLYPFTAPVNGDFSWINQGGASVTTTNGGIFLLAPAAAGTQLRTRKKSAPSTPYTVTAAFLPLLNNLNYSYCGIGWRQSSTGEIIAYGVQHSATAKLVLAKYNSATSYNSLYFEKDDILEFYHNVFFLRIGDDGVDRTVSISNDGINFLELHSVGRTDFLTADEILFFANCEQATSDTGITLLSWEEA